MQTQHLQHKNEVSRLRNQLQDVRHRLVAMQTRLRQTPPSSPAGTSGGGNGVMTTPTRTTPVDPQLTWRSANVTAPLGVPSPSVRSPRDFRSSADLSAALLRQHLADEAQLRAPIAAAAAAAAVAAPPRVQPPPLQPQAQAQPAISPPTTPLKQAQARERRAVEELDTADVYAVLEEEEALRFTFAALSALEGEEGEGSDAGDDEIVDDYTQSRCLAPDLGVYEIGRAHV
jgi:hypothetical protein